MKVSEIGDDETYQIDLIVTLFAILLVLLLVNVAALVLSRTPASRFELVNSGADAEPFMLRSLDVHYRTRSFWIVRNRQIAELDISALARLWLEKSTGLRLAATLDGVDLKITADLSGTGDGFDVQMLFADERPLVTGGLWRWVWTLAPESDEVRSAPSRATRPVLIYAWSSDEALALMLVEAFRAQRQPVELFLLPADEADFRIGRDRRHFGLDAVLRTY